MSVLEKHPAISHFISQNIKYTLLYNKPYVKITISYFYLRSSVNNNEYLITFVQ